MNLYHQKGSKTLYMKFMIRGQLVRRSTGTRNRELAKQVMVDAYRAAEREALGVEETIKVPLFGEAADAFLDFKRGTIGDSTFGIHEDALNHLRPVFAGRLLSNITREEIKAYQRRRLQEPVERRPLEKTKPKTVNLELETLRGVLIHFRQWERIKRDVKMLRVSEEDEVGRELSEVEQRALLDACQMSGAVSLYTIVVLALDTGARKTTIKQLRWKWINFEERCLKWGKDKTPAGSGRVVPLNDRALKVLQFWASRFPNRKPDHFVFPLGYDGRERSALSLKRRPQLDSSFDPTQPIGTIKTAWNTVRRNAAWILAGRPDLDGLSVAAAIDAGIFPAFHCRFHDLRHTAESRMIRKTNGNIPMVARIMGWSASTMVAMAKKYSHFRVEELRDAVEDYAQNLAHTPQQSATTGNTHSPRNNGVTQ